MENKYYSFIHDKDEIELFYYTIFGGQTKDEDRSDELIFMAASARQKDLTEEERKVYQIGSAEMYHAELAYPKHGFGNFYQRVKRFETDVEGYVSHIGRLPFPEKCLSLYVTVNPVSLKKAFALRAKEIQDVYELLLNSSDKDNEHINNLMLRCIKMSNKIATKAIGKKNWLDIDIDFSEEVKSSLKSGRIRFSDIESKLRLWANGLRISDATVVLICTKGGVHILIPTTGMCKERNPETMMSHMRVHFGEWAKEIEYSSGGVPLPGCFQRGFPVSHTSIIL
jgi:hypothetical protein